MKFKPSTLKPLLKISIENKSVPFILGAPGIGKSAIMRAITKELNTEMFVVSANLLADKSDLTGVTKTVLPDGSDAQKFYPHMTIQEAISYANQNPDKLTILFLDEVNRAPEDVTTGLMSLSTERKIGNIPLPENISVVLAGNDSGNVNSVDSATLSRSVIYRMIPDAKDLLASNAGKNFVAEITDWLQSDASNVFSQPIVDENIDDNNNSAITSEMGEDFDQFTTPRTIEKLSDFIKSLKADNLWDDLLEQHSTYVQGLSNDSVLQEAVYAHIGVTPAANRLLDRLSKSVTVGTGTTKSYPGVPDSVQKVFRDEGSDADAIVDQLQVEFQNDNELATRTLLGLFLRNATPAMPSFSIDTAVYTDVIDMIFNTLPNAQAYLISELSAAGVVSSLALTAVKNSYQPKVAAFNAIMQSLVTGGAVQSV